MFTLEDAQLIHETLESVEKQIEESIGSLLVGEMLEVQGKIQSAAGTLRLLDRLIQDVRDGK